MAQTTKHSSVPFDRTIETDIGELTDDHEITVRVGEETFTGPVTRIDTYGDSTDVERVVQFNISYKHRINGGWEPWKVYLVEEPAGVYRANLVLYNGEESNSRTRNLDAPDEIEISE